MNIYTKNADLSKLALKCTRAFELSFYLLLNLLLPLLTWLNYRKAGLEQARQGLASLAFVLLPLAAALPALYLFRLSADRGCYELLFFLNKSWCFYLSCRALLCKILNIAALMALFSLFFEGMPALFLFLLGLCSFVFSLGLLAFVFSFSFTAATLLSIVLEMLLFLFGRGLFTQGDAAQALLITVPLLCASCGLFFFARQRWLHFRSQ